MNNQTVYCGVHNQAHKYSCVRDCVSTRCHLVSVAVDCIYYQMSSNIPYQSTEAHVGWKPLITHLRYGDRQSGNRTEHLGVGSY